VQGGEITHPAVAQALAAAPLGVDAT
jgi:hypothetical protein